MRLLAVIHICRDVEGKSDKFRMHFFRRLPHFHFKMCERKKHNIKNQNRGKREEKEVSTVNRSAREIEQRTERQRDWKWLGQSERNECIFIFFSFLEVLCIVKCRNDKCRSTGNTYSNRNTWKHIFAASSPWNYSVLMCIYSGAINWREIE